MKSRPVLESVELCKSGPIHTFSWTIVGVCHGCTQSGRPLSECSVPESGKVAQNLLQGEKIMEANEVADYAALGRLLDDSASFDADVARLLEAGWNTASLRERVCSALCKAAFEHSVSQRVLIGAGLNGTALALIRLHFEAVVRAAWTQKGATDKWLEEFAKPVRPGDRNEPQLGPPIPAMLDTIALKEPAMASEFHKLYATAKVMHSFVHGGAHQVVAALRGYEPGKLVSVMKNRNLITLNLCNVTVAGSGRPELQGTVGRLSRTHAGCMPPPAVG